MELGQWWSIEHNVMCHIDTLIGQNWTLTEFEFDLWNKVLVLNKNVVRNVKENPCKVKHLIVDWRCLSYFIHEYIQILGLLGLESLEITIEETPNFLKFSRFLDENKEWLKQTIVKLVFKHLKSKPVGFDYYQSLLNIWETIQVQINFRSNSLNNMIRMTWESAVVITQSTIYAQVTNLTLGVSSISSVNVNSSGDLEIVAEDWAWDCQIDCTLPLWELGLSESALDRRRFIDVLLIVPQNTLALQFLNQNRYIDWWEKLKHPSSFKRLCLDVKFSSSVKLWKCWENVVNRMPQNIELNLYIDAKWGIKTLWFCEAFVLDRCPQSGDVVTLLNKLSERNISNISGCLYKDDDFIADEIYTLIATQQGLKRVKFQIDESRFGDLTRMIHSSSSIESVVITWFTYKDEVDILRTSVASFIRDNFWRQIRVHLKVFGRPAEILDSYSCLELSH